MTDDAMEEHREDTDFAAMIRTHVQKRPLPKRFYKQVSISDSGAGLAIELDGRPVRTPLKHLLSLPNSAMAKEVAAEWEAQAQEIDPAAMPLTRLANTAIDRVAPDLGRIVDEILAYAASDLLCYRAEDPDPLRARQCMIWDPVLDWAAASLGASLVRTTGVMPREQPAEALAALRRHLETYDAFELTALHNMTTLSGSAIIAMAIAEGHLLPQPGWEAAHVDEDWQAEQWGYDAAAARRRAFRWAEFFSAVHLLSLART
ncbi:chaperone required for assembly of F1-ATPase [Rhodoligotrophos appendicifer]|uniref:ATP12 family chaperone protein n=1 Tax=Rhodoligotrophos appendicifer TaxID=987056 RepID=UPI00147979DE|nr:ATP12 family protein [Rhodoligotrophos appendicifer]